MTKGKFIITIVLSILLIGCCLILRTFDKTTHYENFERNFTLHLATPSKPIRINYVAFYETLCFKRKL